MTTITIDELRERLDEVIDKLAHGGEPLAVTRDGAVVAELSPNTGVTTQGAAPTRTREDREAYWAELRQLQRDIAPLWPKGVSALDAIREDRSRLDALGGDRHGR